MLRVKRYSFIQYFFWFFVLAICVLMLQVKTWSPPPRTIKKLRSRSHYYDFFFDPIDKLPCRHKLRKKFKLETFRVKSGLKLFDYFDKESFPYRHLFPLQDSVAVELSQHYDDMGDEFTTVMRPDMMKMVTNKLAFATFLNKNGFARFAPKFYSRETIEHFPVIVKVTNSTGSQGVFLVTNSTILNEVINRLKNREYVIQEFLNSNREQAVQVSAIHGRLLRMICHERYLGEAPKIYSVTSDQAKWWKTPPVIPNADCNEDVYSKILKVMNFTGIGNFDVRFKPGDGSIPKILEFNPRVSGTVARDENLLADLICSIQWNGRGKASENGCQLIKSKH